MRRDRFPAVLVWLTIAVASIAVIGMSFAYAGHVGPSTAADDQARADFRRNGRAAPVSPPGSVVTPTELDRVLPPAACAAPLIVRADDPLLSVDDIDRLWSDAASCSAGLGVVTPDLDVLVSAAPFASRPCAAVYLARATVLLRSPRPSAEPFGAASASCLGNPDIPSGTLTPGATGGTLPPGQSHAGVTPPIPPTSSTSVLR